MAKSKTIGILTLLKNKIVRKGRHSKKHKQKKFARGQGKPI